VPICRTLGIAPSTYYARKTRLPSRRQVEDARLLAHIRTVHEHNDGAYGSRRVWKALRRHGMPVPRCRVERLMRQHGLRGAQSGRKRHWLTVADETAPRPADPGRAAVRRRPPEDRRRPPAWPRPPTNQLWVCDLTYFKTREGLLYLAFVKDVFSRMIVGWQTATHLRTDRVLDALEMAVHLRRPATGQLVHHTDRGSRYTSFRYTQRLAELGIAASVGSVADAYDNAMAESLVGTLKTELLGGRILATRFEADITVVEYLGWFNHTRLHAALGDRPPAEFEALYATPTKPITYTMNNKETN
jgi:putative transposase